MSAPRVGLGRRSDGLDARTAAASGQRAVRNLHRREVHPVGLDRGQRRSRPRVHIYTSPDGLIWTDFVEPDFRTIECYTGALEGADDRVVFLGTNECEGIWLSLAP